MRTVRKIKDEIRDLLGKDIEIALLRIEEELRIDSKHYPLLISIKNRHYKLNSDIAKGIIGVEEKNIQYAKNLDGILNLISNLETIDFRRWNKHPLSNGNGSNAEELLNKRDKWYLSSITLIITLLIIIALVLDNSHRQVLGVFFNSMFSFLNKPIATFDDSIWDKSDEGCTKDRGTKKPEKKEPPQNIESPQKFDNENVKTQMSNQEESSLNAFQLNVVATDIQIQQIASSYISKILRAKKLNIYTSANGYKNIGEISCHVNIQNDSSEINLRSTRDLVFSLDLSILNAKGKELLHERKVSERKMVYYEKDIPKSFSNWLKKKKPLENLKELELNI